MLITDIQQIAKWYTSVGILLENDKCARQSVGYHGTAVSSVRETHRSDIREFNRSESSVLRKCICLSTLHMEQTRKTKASKMRQKAQHAGRYEVQKTRVSASGKCHYECKNISSNKNECMFLKLYALSENEQKKFVRKKIRSGHRTS
ncbi:hypothetical protein PR048_005240 [Dryococelus australis]|uniref:Uncharacterized protein n=1 Tax=Dryococelus australis TaxID=614101 RepID=A0ABQ9I8P5_9NEOP|nr:hypothetical protein PR048_005240 [Dryococelus australis]